MPAIWERLEGVGLDTTEACGDSPRPFLGSPVAGIAKDEIIDGSAALAEIKRRFIGNPDFSNLPRKFKTALTGHPSHDVAPEVNDVSFVGTVHPEHGPGFDLWVGGGLSTNPMLAQKLGVWIPLDEVADAWEGVASIFRDYGYRRLRSRARLKFLVADWGVEKFREVLETEYLHRALVDNPSPRSPVRQRDHIGVHEQKDGKFYVGVAPIVGRVDGTTAQRPGRPGRGVRRRSAPGSRRTRRSCVIGVDGQRRRGVHRRPRANRPDRASLELAPEHDGLHRHRVLQAGDRRHQGPRPALVAELERRFPDLDVPITVNVNGCPNACARTQVADIGLKGQLVMDADGNQVEGFQVHLGGALGLGANFGRKLRAHKVTSAGLDDYVTDVVNAYLADREDGESFADWVVRADDELLRGESLDPLDHRALVRV